MSHEIVLSHKFTEQQFAFIKGMIAGRDKRTAGIEAGYSPENVSPIVWALLQQPAIVAAIQIGVARDLAIGAGVANRVLQEFVADATLDKKLRFACAKTILDRAGHVAPKAVAPGKAGETPLNEMSMTDLRQLADKLEQEIAGRAKDVSSAIKAPKDTQAIDDII